MSIILSAAQTTEDKVHQIQDIARSLVGQGFLSMAYGRQQISAYPNQAETTLNQYAGGGRKPNKCWGCVEDDHPWRKREGPIVSHMKDNPACIKHAEDKHRKFIEKRRARGSRNPRNKSDADHSTDTGKQLFMTKMRTDVLAATTSTALTPTTSLGTSGPTVFFMSRLVPVLSASPAH